MIVAMVRMIVMTMIVMTMMVMAMMVMAVMVMAVNFVTMWIAWRDCRANRMQRPP